MLINQDELQRIIKSYLRQAPPETAARLSEAVVLDAEALIFSLIRQAAAQEREALYLVSSKTG